MERWLLQLPPGSMLLAQDVPIIAPLKTIRNQLALHASSGTLKRITSGVYYKPKHHPVLGEVRPSVSDIADVIARRDGARIMPTGALALNQLGISTQIPMRVAFLTDGAARTVKLDKGEIVFKKANLKMLSLQGRYSQLAVLAMKELGQDHVDEYVAQAISMALQRETSETLLADMKQAPAWMQPYFLTAIKEKKQSPKAYDIMAQPSRIRP